MSKQILLVSSFALMSSYLFPTTVCAVQGPNAAQEIDRRIVQADSIHDAGDPVAALRTLESVLQDRPSDFVALWKAAREAIAIGVLTEGTDEQNGWYDIARDFAARALELRPNDFTAEYWLVAAQGLRAIHADALTAARLGTSVYERSHSLLARDSLDAGANHALGLLNLEVMKLSRVKRFIAVTILGNRAFRDTSWENAEFYLERAVAIDSTFPVYQLDLGKAYFYQGKYARAREQLGTVLTLPDQDPTDVAFRVEASRYLQRIP